VYHVVILLEMIMNMVDMLDELEKFLVLNLLV